MINGDPHPPPHDPLAEAGLLDKAGPDFGGAIAVIVEGDGTNAYGQIGMTRRR
jgi:hypothetical protein